MNDDAQNRIMHRRTFLQRWLLVAAGVIATSLLALASRYGWRRDEPLNAEEAAEAIRRHFSYLKLDEQGVAGFAQEFTSQRGPVYAGDCESLYLTYLMSSSFFANGGDESQTVTCDSMYDPYAGCVNPFAEF